MSDHNNRRSRVEEVLAEKDCMMACEKAADLFWGPSQDEAIVVMMWMMKRDRAAGWPHICKALAKGLVDEAFVMTRMYVYDLDGFHSFRKTLNLF